MKLQIVTINKVTNNIEVTKLDTEKDNINKMIEHIEQLFNIEGTEQISISRKNYNFFIRNYHEKEKNYS